MQKNETIIKPQSISLPKGGASIKSLNETFTPSLFSGSGSYSIPIPITPARGFEPKLSLNYSSNVGNNPFGLGFSLSISSFSIRTQKGLPKYDGSDIYLFNGEELVFKNETQNEDIQEFLPRIESDFSLIQYFVSEKYWKVTTRDNSTFIYGKDPSCRIYDLNDPNKIFTWLIESSADCHGNKIKYNYKQENNDNIPNKSFEQNRSLSNKYIKTIEYGNYILEDQEQFAYTILFDYGEHTDKTNPFKESSKWDYREDSFSSYQSCFEIRTRRLCKNIFLFHNFKEELGEDNYLIKGLNLEYSKTKNSALSILTKATHSGYEKKNGKYLSQSIPPVILEYSSFEVENKPQFKQLSLKNNTQIPDYLQNSLFQSIDLYGEGISGLLYSDGSSIMYCEPLGDAQYDTPKEINSFPIDKNFQTGKLSLVDLEGNGELELVVQDGSRKGFYSYTNDKWEQFKPFQSYPTDSSNPNIESTNLSNNGKTDLLLIDGDNILVYPSIGKDGFTAQKSIKTVNLPTQKKGYVQEFVGFGDFFGDGMSHRVKITANSVECWPNLGYGKFGEKIELNISFDIDKFDTSKLFLADIDGSGTTDLIYVDGKNINLYLNQSGNSFSTITTTLPDEFTNIDQIHFSDILGNGTTCMVFTKMSTIPTHYYYNFVKEIKSKDEITQVIKPYLLNKIDNSMGAFSQIIYSSSTYFYLEDKRSGNPWATKLHFPVQVVSKTIHTDQIANSRLTSLVKYHDGYYDHIEKEFRGFGFVESFDTEDFEEFENNTKDSPVQTNDKKHYSTPIYTKTWQNVGFDNFTYYKDLKDSFKGFYSGDDQAYNFPNPTINVDDTLLNEAYRALKGSVFRSEVYSQENTKDPYSVSQSANVVNLFQDKSENPYAVFTVHNQENINYHYEQNPKDPRIEQNFTLKVDKFLNILESCHISLPRRANDDIRVFPEQQETKAILSTNNYVTPLNEFLYSQIAYESKSFEILNLKTPNYFSFDEISKNITNKNLLTHHKSYFWDSDLNDIAPFGTIGLEGLIHHSEEVCFNKEFLSTTFDTLISDDILNQYGGYIFEEGYWWNKGLTQFYDKKNFFLANKTANTFVDKSSSLYTQVSVKYDKYNLFTIETSQYKDQQTNLTQTATIDYRVSQAKELIDENQNSSQVLFDTLGNVIVSSIIGSEAGKNAGAMRLYDSHTDKKEYTLVDSPSLDDIVSNTQKYLQGASSYFFYTLNNYSEKQQPNSTISLVRDNHYHQDETFSCQTSITYSDGAGHTLVVKQNSEDENGKSCWLTNGKSIFNNKGNVVESYLPFNSDTYNFEIEKDPKVAPTITHYDPLDRVVRVDTPKGFFTKVEFSSWGVKHYDENDTILDSTYYKENYTKLSSADKDAIDKATKFYNTPSVQIFDSKGTPFLSIANNLGKVTPDIFKDAQIYTTLENSGFIKDGFLTNKFWPYDKDFTFGLKQNEQEIIDILKQNCLVSYSKTDIVGRELKTIDPRLYYSNTTKGTDYYNFKYIYPMNSAHKDKDGNINHTPVLTNSIDAGIQKHLDNIYKKQLFSYSPRGFFQIITYDNLQNQKELLIKRLDQEASILPSFDSFSIVEKFIYGNDPKLNNVNKLIKLYDLSGLVSNESFSISGETLSSSRTMIKEYKDDKGDKYAVDWRVVNDSVLEEQTYTTSFTYNALGQILNQTTPDNSITTNTYNSHGALKTISVTQKGTTKQIIKNILYNSNGLRVQTDYGNSITTNYTYEGTTNHLIALKSSKDKQDISYTYDPVGNITQLIDNSYEAVYNKTKVMPKSQYTYDALYRLVQATGRKHPGLNKDATTTKIKECVYSPTYSINDYQVLQNYTENYSYDDSGNRIDKECMAVEENSNRLKNLSYDDSGNLREISPNTNTKLKFNCCENLVKVTAIPRTDNIDDCDYYDYDSTEHRTRKITQSLGKDSAIQIDEKVYLGNYEIKRKKTNENITLERQTLKVMDGDRCIAIIHHWIKGGNETADNTTSIRYQFENHLNSVSLELSEAGELISYEEYMPYSGTAFIAGKNQKEVDIKEYKYSQKEKDSSTGFYYYGRRYYVSWLGRWLNADPAGRVDGMNIFAFVGGNPIGHVDVDGLMIDTAKKVTSTANTYHQVNNAYNKHTQFMQIREAFTNFIEKNKNNTEPIKELNIAFGGTGRTGKESFNNQLPENTIYIDGPGMKSIFSKITGWGTQGMESIYKDVEKEVEKLKKEVKMDPKTTKVKMHAYSRGGRIAGKTTFLFKNYSYLTLFSLDHVAGIGNGNTTQVAPNTKVHEQVSLHNFLFGFHHTRFTNAKYKTTNYTDGLHHANARYNYKYKEYSIDTNQQQINGEPVNMDNLAKIVLDKGESSFDNQDTPINISRMLQLSR